MNSHYVKETFGREIFDHRLAGIGKTIKLILAEYNQSIAKRPPINSPHEGWALMEQMMANLWDEIRKEEQSQEVMLREAARICAMTMRFMVDLGLVEKGKNRPLS